MHGTLKAAVRHSMVEWSFNGQNQSKYVERNMLVAQSTGFKP
jgi:hypothetical protein